MADKTIIVTGGAGHIGSHLIDMLIDSNRVICVDNVSSGYEKNIEHLKNNPNFKFINGDIRKQMDIDGDVDEIYCLASRASPPDFSRFPVDILMTNSFGLYNMLNLAKTKNARLLYSSSSEVYGDPKEHPQRESYWGNVNPVGARSCYDEAKRFGESLSVAFSKEFGSEVRIARIFNTYGPRMRIDDGRIIPNFITQALRDQPITVYGDGKQTRSFCYVSDMVSGLISLMGSDMKAKPVNFGNEDEMTVLEVAERIKNLTGSGSEIVFKDLPENDPERRKPDISLAKGLGWEPSISFDEGLKKTIEWFRGML